MYFIFIFKNQIPIRFIFILCFNFESFNLFWWGNQTTDCPKILYIICYKKQWSCQLLPLEFMKHSNCSQVFYYSHLWLPAELGRVLLPECLEVDLAGFLAACLLLDLVLPGILPSLTITLSPHWSSHIWINRNVWGT